jgi:hypothetical protein
VTALWAVRPSCRGSIPGSGNGFSLLQKLQPVSGALAVPCFPVGNGGSFPGVKHPAHEPRRSHPCNVEFKNDWSSSSLL